ncbi:MAG: ISAs1 family transposase [Saprospiraceae bacterium]
MVASGNDYIVQVKHRKKRLTTLIQQCVVENAYIEQANWTEKIEEERKRELSVYHPSQALKEDWPHVKKVIALRRIRTVKDQQTDKTHYYISSWEQGTAETLGQCIRQHWAVENKLHWVKDVVMREDHTKFHSYKTYKLNALYQNFACSNIRLNKQKSVKYAMETLRENPKRIIKLLRT